MPDQLKKVFTQSPWPINANDTRTLAQASIVQLLKGVKRPNSSYSRKFSKCNFRLHQLHSTKKTIVGATSPWFANGTIWLLHLVTFLRHRLNDQQPQHDKDASNNQCSCSQLKPLQPQQIKLFMFYLSFTSISKRPQSSSSTSCCQLY